MMASTSNLSDIDAMRVKTNFDATIKGFCDSLNIPLPHKGSTRHSARQPARALTPDEFDLQDTLDLSQIECNAALRSLVGDVAYQKELGYHVQLFMPLLDDAFATKVGYACGCKLIAAYCSGYHRAEWEDKICRVLLASHENFDVHGALNVCRIVEIALRKWSAKLVTKSAFPAASKAATAPQPVRQASPQQGTVYLNADTAGAAWQLARSDDHYVANAGLLVALFSVAAEQGWHNDSLVSCTRDLVSVTLRPCRVSGYEATKLRNVLMSAMVNRDTAQNDEATRENNAFLNFLHGGGFDLRKHH